MNLMMVMDLDYKAFNELFCVPAIFLSESYGIL